MRKNKYIGVYYSDSHFKDLNAFTTFSLFFDEIHLITTSTRLSNEQPTDFFKNLSDKVQIVLPKDVDEIEITKIKDFTQFIMNNRELIGDLLFFHNDLIGGSISEFSHRLLTGNVPIDDFMKFFAGETKEKHIYDEFTKNNPELKDDYHIRISSTAYDLATKNDWVLIGDQSEIQLPFMSFDERNIKLLTTMLAEECLRIVLPKCLSLNSEDILLAREKLKDELIPFRITLQKMSAILRDGIKNCKNINELKLEAKFVVENQVEPALNDIIRRIEIEKDKLWIKIFGKVIGWIPFVAKGFLTPNPESIFKAMEKVYGDVGSLASGINEFDIAKEPGLSFLLKTDKLLNIKSP